MTNFVLKELFHIFGKCNTKREIETQGGGGEASIHNLLSLYDPGGFHGWRVLGPPCLLAKISTNTFQMWVEKVLDVFSGYAYETVDRPWEQTLKMAELKLKNYSFQFFKSNICNQRTFWTV